jgi:hypothetical protein
VKAIERSSSRRETRQKAHSEVIERPFLHLTANLIRLLLVCATTYHNNATRNGFGANRQVDASSEVESFLQFGTRLVVEMDRLP